MTEPTLRALELADVEAARRLVTAALGVSRSAADFHVGIGRPDRACWVLIWADEVVGWLSCAWVMDELELYEIAVAQAWRGRGWGQRLLAHLYAFARSRGVRTVHLEVREGNTVARSWYRRRGFEEVGRRVAYYRDGEDAILYSLGVSEGVD